MRGPYFISMMQIWKQSTSMFVRHLDMMLTGAAPKTVGEQFNSDKRIHR